MYNYETKKYTKIYDYDKLKSLDKYDIYLSGPSSIIDIVNPTSIRDTELIVFLDSYGLSLIHIFQCLIHIIHKKRNMKLQEMHLNLSKNTITAVSYTHLL